MIAKLAYLTTPSPGMFVLNIQPEGSEDLLRFEICKAHLANILISGTAVALREDSINRVQIPQAENANGHTAARS